MHISAIRPDPTAVDVRTDETTLRVVLADGREITVPLAWFPLLHGASDEQRRQWEFIGRGVGIHWPAIDEDISVEGLLRVR